MIYSSLLLQPGETKIVVLRPHWIILLRAILITVVLSALPLVLVMIVSSWSMVGLSVPWQTLIILGGSSYALAVLGFFGYAFIDYWLDMWTVTTRRIIHIEQKGLFNRQIDELELVRIQDATSATKGILGTLLGYGTILVQTAAEMPRFMFRDIPHPEKVRELIMKLSRECRAHTSPT